MARQFQIKRFLRQTPAALFAEYAEKHDLQLDFDLSTLDRKNVHDAAAKLAELPEEQRQKIDADFRDVDAVATEAGFRALMSEADWQITNNPSKFGHDVGLRERLAAMENDHERAMWVFPKRSHYWHGTIRFCQADIIGPSRWQKRRDLPQVDARVDDATKAKLATALGQYFLTVQGRGKRCEVEILRRVEDGLDYFFCFGEGFSEAPHSWIQGRLGRHPRNPAHESFLFRMITFRT